MRSCSRLMLVALTIASMACAGSSTGPSGLGSTLNVMIKDSPFSDAKALLVTFSEVSAHVSDGDSWRTLPFSGGATTRTCDLKKLETAQDVLGTGTLTAGHYTQVRLIVTGAALYFDNASAGPACAASISSPSGRSTALTVSSGEIKLNREFEVTTAGATTILVDFDGDKSVKDMGNGLFHMSPVISVVSVQ